MRVLYSGHRRRRRRSGDGRPVQSFVGGPQVPGSTEMIEGVPSRPRPPRRTVSYTWFQKRGFEEEGGHVTSVECDRVVRRVPGLSSQLIFTCLLSGPRRLLLVSTLPGSPSDSREF